MARTRSTTCYECNVRMTHAGAFCTPAHKAAFHNRRAKRGALLLDVLGLMRKYPDKTATFAARLELLWDRWEKEDEAAGRRSMTRALTDVEYDSTFPRAYELAQNDVS